MCLNVNREQLNTSRQCYRSAHMKPVVTTNQKPTIDAQKLERKKYKYTAKENHKTTREKTKIRRTEKNYKNNQNK